MKNIGQLWNCQIKSQTHKKKRIVWGWQKKDAKVTDIYIISVTNLDVPEYPSILVKWIQIFASIFAPSAKYTCWKPYWKQMNFCYIFCNWSEFTH